MGTAKLSVVAYDVTTKQAVINSGYALARSDHQNWTVLGAGNMQGGTLNTELVQATGEYDLIVSVPTAVAARPSPSPR